MSLPRDPRDELREIAASARGLLEWHGACGTTGLPIDPDAAAAEAAAAATGARSKPASATSPAQRPAPAPPPAPTVAPAPRDDVAPEERVRRLEIIADTVKGCTKCVLSETRTNTVFSRGNPLSELCFIGEGPGADEDREGLPFVGKAGELLDKMIGAMGYARDDVYICNIVKCRPPGNRNPEPAEVTACAPYLTEQIGLVRPKVIVTLGNVPLKALFGTEGITKLRGTWRLYRGEIPTMPTYHPAYVLRNPTEKVRGDVWNDLKQVLIQLGKQLPKRKS